MLKIVIFVGDNPYQSTALFAASLAQGINEEGGHARVLSFKEGEEYEVLAEIFNDPPDLTCSFSDITMGEVGIGEAWKIPHVSFLIDPFVYFMHQAKGAFSSVTTADLE